MVLTVSRPAGTSHARDSSITPLSYIYSRYFLYVHIPEYFFYYTILDLLTRPGPSSEIIPNR